MAPYLAFRAARLWAWSYTEASHSVVETTAKAACDLEAELARVDVALERAEAEMRARPGSRAGADATANTAKTEITDSLVREAGQLVAMILAAVAQADSVGGEEKGEAPEVPADLESCSADEQQGHRDAVGRSLWRALGALRWLTAVQLLGAGESRKEEVVEEAGEAARDVVKTARKGLENALLDVKVAAMEQLEKLASSVGEAGESVLGGVADTGIGKTCGALLAPMTGLLADAVRAGAARRAAKLWQVREVAAVVIFRVLGFLREKVRARVESQEAQSNGTWDHEGVERVQQELQACVMQSLAYEPVASVRAVLLRGEALAEELNLVHGATQPAKEKEAASPGEERCGAWAEIKGAVEVELAAGLAALEKARAEAEREAEPLKKQERLLACREALASLAGVSRNVQDIGSALQVLMAFLTGVNTKLDAMGASLDKLQEEVSELREDVRRLVGRPVREMLAKQRERRAKQWEQLRDKVHIPIEGMKADENGEFVLDKQRSQAEDMLALVTREFLQSEQKDVLLLSGPAGSGKSTFVRQLEHHLESVLAKEYVDVLMVMVSLPTLQNPVTDLFTEALRHKGLREAQIHELRDLVEAGEVRLVLLLDAYDELKPQFQFTNLYVSNSLEQFRRQDHAQDGKASPSSSWVGPKVIVTSRTELLMRDKQYANSFVPLEMDNEDKCDDNKAMGFFLELRIVSFENKLDAYMHAKVALEVRRAFQLRVGALAPVSEEAARGLFEAARKALEVSGDSAECECVEATCLAVAVTGGGEVPPERLTQLNNASKKLPTDGALPFYQMALVLATALKELPADLDKCLRAFAGEQARLGQEEQIWQHADYRRTFDVIPELQELTTTPFMVEIVTEILPQLDAMQSTDASIKAKLLLLLDERATQLTWRQICTWRSEHDADRAGQPAATRAPILQRVQEALDRPAEGDRGGAELKALEELSIRVGDVLKAKKLVLEQPKLVAIARAQTKRWRGAVPDGRARQNVVGDGTDEEFDDAVEEVLEDLMIDAAAEEEICGGVVRYVLRIALCRTKVRGSDIYRMFVARYVEREARKAAAGGAHTADSVRREGRQYAQRLALEMVLESVSKVPIASDSELFHEESIWDPFLRGKELLQAAQKAAPVLNDGTMLTFIHKTVQEYLCAAALRDTLHLVFHNLAVPLKRLQDNLIQSTAPADSMQLEQGHASEREQKGRGAGGPRSAQDVSAGVRVGPEGRTQEDAAMTEKALLRVEQRLLKSVWARVDLRREDVVRDFLVDMFLDEPELVAEVYLLVTWVERRCKRGRLQRGEACEGGMLLENVRAVLGGALPKRAGGTLLHAAASEDSYFALTMALEMIDARLLEAVDDDGRTLLFCAAQRGHAQVVAALRAAGAKHDTRSNLQPSVRLIATVPYTLLPATMSGHTLRAAQPAVHFQRGGLVKISGSEKTILEHGIVGAPAAAPSEGWWRYEVEVDFKGNDVEMYRAKEAREGYCLGFCVGWSSRDARQVCWNHVSQSLDEIKDQEDGAAWFQKLGLQLGTNDWSCGLRDSGEWGSPSGAAPRADDGSSKPDAAAHAPIDLKCSGNTPVMEAASHGHMEVCSLLLDRAAVEDVGRQHQRERRAAGGDVDELNVTKGQASGPSVDEQRPTGEGVDGLNTAERHAAGARTGERRPADGGVDEQRPASGGVDELDTAERHAAGAGTGARRPADGGADELDEPALASTARG
ncbi:hypothetical protein CYMTET_26943 [Cymbomonas tetramitiformis]|uniref:AAA+ ATPase domain-containing protein n=1 Tax=Cymbomonas tetramitiformis TaxID=36881 RepID=A0AAE0FR25_9CHLO|nr:hypothetical protein CYMTET_26943 [Cymbomonas tetramitiformis]